MRCIVVARASCRRELRGRSGHSLRTKRRSARRSGGRITRPTRFSKPARDTRSKASTAISTATAGRFKGPSRRERVIEASEKKEEVGLIPGLDPHEQYTKIKTAVGLGPNEQIARQDYVEGDRLFREKNYKAAAEKFQAAVDRGPHSAIEQDAMFMVAESYFYDDRYIKPAMRTTRW